MKSSSSLSSLYSVIAFCNILVNLDHGIIPAATKEIKTDLQLAEVELGLLGSVVYAGLIFGSLTAGQIFQKYNSKSIILVAVGAYAVGLIVFPITKNILLLGMSRFLVGFFQVFLVVYFPVWVDLFGGKKKTMWLTFLQLGVPFGVFLGYALTSIFVNIFGEWKLAFFTQIAFLVPCLFLFFRFDEEDMETNDAIAKIQQYARRNSLTLIERNSIYDISNRNSYVLPEKSVISDEDTTDNPYNNEIKLDLDEKKIQEKTLMHVYLNNLNNLWERKLYICTLLSLSSLFFVITGIQFWISDYMRIILKKDQQTVFIAYSISALTAPTFGVLLGGILLDKYGGYTGPHALNICLFFGTMASLTGIPIPFFDDFRLVVTLLWFLLFFGGALMPAVTGMMISSIPKYLRAFGNSNAQLVSNLLGYFPSPFLYGLVCNLTGGEESRGGMILLMFWSVWGVLGLLTAKKFFNSQLKKTAADQNIEIELKDLNKVCLRSSFVQFRDKNTAFIFDDYLERKNSIHMEEKPPEFFETGRITMKLRRSEDVLHEKMQLSTRFSEYPHTWMESSESPKNRKLTIVKINSNSIHMGEEFFRKEGLETGFLREGGRTSTRRRTSLFGNLGVMFGKNNMFLEKEEEEEGETG